MSVREALQVHSAGRTGNGTSTAALTQSAVDSGQTAILTDTVVIDLADFISDGAVGANLGAVATAVTQQLVGLGSTGVGGQLILGKQTDDLDSGSACLCDGLGDILGTLADTGQEHTGRGRFHGAQFRMCLSQEMYLRRQWISRMPF